MAREALKSVEGRVIFSSSFDGLFREYQATFTEGTIERLVEAGVDPQRPLLPAYPKQVWYDAIRILVEDHHAGLAYSDGVREVGRSFMRGYFETPLGRTIMAVLRILGPLRSLKRMSRNFRTGNNFSETQTHEDAPGDVRLEVNDCIADSPEFIRGLLEVGMARVGATDPTIEVLSVRDDGHAVYRIRWKV